MSEELPASSAQEGIDPVATSLALAGADRSEANAFLRDQRHHMHEQLKEIGLRLWELRLGVALRLATLVIGLAVATGFGLIVWDAAHSTGLLVEPFNVPPGFAARGLSGEVVAGQVLDKLTTMQASTLSYRASRSFANNWGNDAKVEIPETGVSIGELRRFLREWLGRDTHISGDVWQTDSGVAISIRTGAGAPAVFAGAQTEFDALVQKAAEFLLFKTQPYRYGNYLRGQRRYDEARAVYMRLTDDPSIVERGWAWQGLATLAQQQGGNAGADQKSAAEFLRKAVAVHPDYVLGYDELSSAEASMGHDEAALAAAKAADRLLHRGSIPDIEPSSFEQAKMNWGSDLPGALGDYAQVAAMYRHGIEQPDTTNIREALRESLVIVLARQHDPKAARAYLAEIRASSPKAFVNRRAYLPFLIAVAAEQWDDILALKATTETIAGTGVFDHAYFTSVIIRPAVGMALAMRGDFAGAESTIAPMPGDCFPCLIARARIAELQGQRARADFWFARATQAGPSLPFAFEAQARALLGRGQLDATIAQFTIANKKGPHFADAFEGWGEALMAKNQSHLALEKFAEADKYAPNWGRLHLKWGEALWYAGKHDDAKAQFTRAAALDLTPSEKSELAKASHV